MGGIGSVKIFGLYSTHRFHTSPWGMNESGIRDEKLEYNATSTTTHGAGERVEKMILIESI